METGPVLMVNVDIAFVVNLMTDFAWLWATARLSGLRPRLWRLMAASALGAAAAVWAYFPDGRWLATGPGAWLGTGVLLGVAFLPCSPAQAVRTGAYAILSGAAMAGVAMLTSSRDGFASPLVVAGLLMCLAGARYLWESARDRARLSRGLYRLRISLGERIVDLAALMDTGNSLKEPLSGVPVVVVEAAALEALLPPVVLAAARSGWDGLDRLPQSWTARCRLVPFRSVGRPVGVMLAVQPDELACKEADGQTWVPVEGLVGLAREQLHPDGLYQALLPPQTLRAAAEIPETAWEGRTG